ncbi:hypothetical protein Q1695_009903 [Nippostrongylus brasiliensis]|nr:hypothetical protein Q1695_009903 [Nippostrongylus brasiliensis]
MRLRWLFVLFASVLLSIPVLFSIWMEHIPLHDVPKIAEDRFWGRGDVIKDDDQIKLFNIQIEDERIEELKARLATDRLVDPIDDCPLSAARHELMSNLSKVMAAFNWKQHQQFLNSFKQYRTQIEGLNIHFLRVSLPKEPSVDVVPLLLLHGFPGSHWTFYKVIPILTNPVRFGFDFGVKRPLRFEVIVPSLPGFLFSSKIHKAGFHTTDAARIMGKLMRRLTVQKYFVHGSELLGTEIAATVAALYPTEVRGAHLSNPIVHPQFSTQVFFKTLMENFPRDEATSSRSEFLERSHDLALNSELIGDALASSPLGSASYLMSVWSMFSSRDRSQMLNDLFTLDELATVSYLYFLTGTTPHAASMMRTFMIEELPRQRWQVRTPCGILQSPETPWISSRSILRHRFLNITSFTTASRGGAFLHLQDPNAFAADVFRFVEPVLL